MSSLDPDLSGYKLKNSRGVYLTRSLFYEQYVQIPVAERIGSPVFTLYGRKDGLISARDTFIELKDPSGHFWTEKYLNGDTNHWAKLMSTRWFREAYESWVADLERKLKAEAFQKIQEIKDSNTAQAFQAAKYLNKEEWKHETGSRGRPTKEEAKGELKKAMQVLSEEDEDLKRIGGLSVIEGGKAAQIGGKGA